MSSLNNSNTVLRCWGRPYVWWTAGWGTRCRCPELVPPRGGDIQLQTSARPIASPPSYWWERREEREDTRPQRWWWNQTESLRRMRRIYNQDSWTRFLLNNAHPPTQLPQDRTHPSPGTRWRAPHRRAADSPPPRERPLHPAAPPPSPLSAEDSSSSSATMTSTSCQIMSLI